jgi:AcrR family transcriptional regulator
MGIKERKEREREARRKEIVEAAKEVFFEYGFQSATMEQIAKRVELSKGTLYLYFSSKEELYVTVFMEGLDELNRFLGEAAESADGWENRLRAIGKAYYRFYCEQKKFFEILFFIQHGASIAQKVPEPLFEECRTKGFECLFHISRTVGEGMAEGEIRQGDPMEIAIASWGSITGILFLYEEDEHRKIIPTPMEKVVMRGLDMLIDGIKIRATA